MLFRVSLAAAATDVVTFNVVGTAVTPTVAASVVTFVAVLVAADAFSVHCAVTADLW